MRLAVLLTVATLLSVTPALAQPGLTPPSSGVHPPSQPYESAPRRVKKYGATIALTDLASATAIVVGSFLVLGDAYGDGDGAGGGALLLIGGVAGYGFGGALIHALHDNSAGAVASIGLRLGLPLVGGLIGEAMSETRRDGDVIEERQGPVGELVTLGILGAVVIDWLVLARVEVPVTPYAAAAPGGGSSFGIAGSF